MEEETCKTLRHVFGGHSCTPAPASEDEHTHTHTDGQNTRVIESEPHRAPDGLTMIPEIPRNHPSTSGA